MAISSIGVGSGLPLDQLLNDLRTTERQSLTLIQQRTVKEQSRLSANGTLKSGIEALKTAAEALGKADTYGAMKTSVSGEAFTASAGTGAIAGSYRVNVTGLAQSQSLRSETGVDTTDTTLVTGAGTVSIAVELADGTTTTLEVDAADASLEGIIKAFNDNTEVGVGATVVNNGAETGGNFLLMNAKGTGTQAAISNITITGDGTTDVTTLQNVLGYEGTAAANGSGMMEASAAQNATVEINGIAVTSQTNTLEGAIEGVTLNLTKDDAGEQTLTVSRDDAVTKKAVEELVNKYNGLLTSIGSLTAYNTETNKGAALSGDSLARRVQSEVRSALNVAVEGLNLSQLGITTDYKTGKLSIDSSKLDTALKDNLPRVQELFSGTGGISERMTAVTDQFVRDGGIISTTTDSINNNIRKLGEQYDSASERIDNKMEIYRRQFTQLDTMMARMNSTSAYLTQQLSMLSQLSSQGSKE